MVSLIDVENSLDNKNLPVGHELKLLKDFRLIFKDKMEILAGKKYIQKLGGQGTQLPCSLCSGKHSYNGFKILFNYFISLVLARGDILLFIEQMPIIIFAGYVLKAENNLSPTRKI